MIGFRPIQHKRQAIFGEQRPGKVGYVETHSGAVWFQDAQGKRIARIIRYKDYQKPQAHTGACGGTIVPFGLGE